MMRADNFSPVCLWQNAAIHTGCFSACAEWVQYGKMAKVQKGKDCVFYFAPTTLIGQ